MDLELYLFEKYFWSKVDDRNKNGCWIWCGSRTGGKHSYGRLKICGFKYPAHQIAFALSGRSLRVGNVVRHTCDNPPCVNPTHLVQGTHADNVRDSVERKRHSHNERHGGSKLTHEQVREIRNRYAKGDILQRTLAVEFNVTRANISHIVVEKQWTE